MTRHVYRLAGMVYVEIKTPAGHVVCGCGRREWETYAEAREYCRQCCELRGRERMVEDG